MRLRFPKAARLRRSSEFQHLKRHGVSVHGKLMVVSVAPIPSPAEPGESARIGFITSRRVGGAVVRNRVRRRLRELVRLSRPQFPHGMWIVVIARQHAANASFQAMQDEWIRLAHRAGIIPQPK